MRVQICKRYSFKTLYKTLEPDRLISRLRHYIRRS